MLTYICTKQRRIITLSLDVFTTVNSMDNVPDAFWKIEYDEINVTTKRDIMLAIGNAFNQAGILVCDLAGGLTQQQYGRYMNVLRELREINSVLVSLQNIEDDEQMFLIPSDIAATLKEF